MYGCIWCCLESDGLGEPTKTFQPHSVIVQSLKHSGKWKPQVQFHERCSVALLSFILLGSHDGGRNTSNNPAVLTDSLTAAVNLG